MSTCPVVSTEHIIVGTDVNLNYGGLKLELPQFACEKTFQLMTNTWNQNCGFFHSS